MPHLNFKKRIALALAAALLGLGLAPTASAAPVQAASGLMAARYCNDGYYFATNQGIPVASGLDHLCYFNRDAANRGDHVLVFQQTYNKCWARKKGTAQIDEDGIFGNQTYGAVANLQYHWNLYRDGKYGPETASKFYDFAYECNPNQ